MRGAWAPDRETDELAAPSSADAAQGQLIDAAGIDAWSRGARTPLPITVSENGTTTTLAAGGEWDLAERPAVRHAIGQALERRPHCVVLDLSQLRFIDSTGIEAVIELQNRCAQQNAHFVIIPGPPRVQRPFEICRLTDRLPFLRASA